VALAAALVIVGAAFNAARAGEEGKQKVQNKKVVIFRSGGSWLGVQIADVDTERGKELGLRDVHGAEVQSVSPGSPAEEAGIKEGDVITEYQGSRIEGVTQLTRLVRETPSGRTASIEIWRNGSSKDLQVQMKPREHDDDDLPGNVHVWTGDGDGDGKMTWFHTPAPPEPPDVDLRALEGLGDLQMFGVPGMRPRLGITVDSVGKQLAEYFGVKQGGGALVTAVGKGSAGETAGLKAGDVIVKVDDEAIQDAGDLHMAMRHRRGKALALTVVRERRETTIKVPEPPEGDTPAPGAHSRPAVDHQEIQREIQRAMRDARRAMRDSEQARREAMATQRAAYAEALRTVQEATRVNGARGREYREALQQMLERLQSEIDRQEAIDGTPEAIAIDDEPSQDAIEDAVEEGVEQGLEEGIEQGRQDGSAIEEHDTPAPSEEEDRVDAGDATDEQRAEIRRAVEEARRIRIQMQQESDR
jgi:membrane-associated protease RseP (regulator of RpoE activity)